MRGLMPKFSMVRRSQSIKAVVLLSCVMILAVLVGSAFLLFDLHNRELTHAKGEIASLSRILSEQTTRAFDGVSLSMRGARERLSDDFGRHLELDSAPVRLLLQSRVGGLPQAKSMFLVDRDGMVVNSSRKDFSSPFSVAQRTFFSHFAQNSDLNCLFHARSKRISTISGPFTSAYDFSIRPGNSEACWLLR